MAPIAAWVTSQSLKQTRDRDRQTCRSLALFIKGLAIQSQEEIEAHKAAHGGKAKGLAAAMKQAKLAEIRARSLSHEKTMMTDAQRKRAQAVQAVQQASRHRREKSTRTAVQAEEIEQQRRQREEARMEKQRQLEQQLLYVHALTRPPGTLHLGSGFGGGASAVSFGGPGSGSGNGVGISFGSPEHRV